MHHLSGPDVSTARAAVKSFTASFAEWRRGTLHEVCKQLRRLQPFRDVLAQVLRRRVSTKAGVVMETFGSDRFWQLNKACAILGSELEDFRQWCCGCPCHEAECVALRLMCISSLAPSQDRSSLGWRSLSFLMPFLLLCVWPQADLPESVLPTLRRFVG